MISEKINEAIRIAMICVFDKRKVKRGMVFDELTLSEENCLANCGSPAPVRCHGMIEDSLLVSVLKGRYYLKIKDGWGAEGNHLYGMNADNLLEFKTPTTMEDLEKMISEPMKKKGTYAVMGEELKRKRIEKVLEVLRAEQADK